MLKNTFNVLVGLMASISPQHFVHPSFFELGDHRHDSPIEMAVRHSLHRPEYFALNFLASEGLTEWIKTLDRGLGHSSSYSDC